MAGDLIQFVDSIASSPTVRLNLNDETTWSCSKFEAPPPRLRRAVSANAMRDGLNVSASQYEARTLTLTLELKTASQDTNATQLQLLARELDRTDNFLRYQPTGATKPVFFSLYRSDLSAVVDVTVQTAMRILTVELLAEPFALGLRESVGPITVSNNPAAGANGCFFDISTGIGDVPAPLFLHNASTWRASGVIHTRRHGVPSDLTFFKQAENAFLSTDTTNPGGGPDANMSGTGVNNFVRTSFATTATMATRLNWDLATNFTTNAHKVALRGTYRAYAVVRRSAATSALTVRAQVNYSLEAIAGPTRTLGTTTSRQLVDLGVFDLSSVPARLPYAASDSGVADVPTVSMQAARTGGTDTLDWDCIFILPADEQAMTWQHTAASIGGLGQVVDGYQNRVYAAPQTDPFAAGAELSALRSSPPVTGGFPVVVPNQVCRYYVMLGSVTSIMPVADTHAWTAHYWPRYLYVRPSAT